MWPLNAGLILCNFIYFTRDFLLFSFIWFISFCVRPLWISSNILYAWTSSLVTSLIWQLFYLLCSSIVVNTVIVTAGNFEPSWKGGGGGVGALKSDSTHHFFRNACTKSGSLRFSQFSGCWLILSVYILRVLTFPLLDCSEFGNFVITFIYELESSHL
jgi:hypothetical protein